MDGSRSSSMAQLSAWTSAMRTTTESKPEEKPQSKSAQIEEDYEEEFEDYDEDFEDESPVKAAPPPKQEAKAAPVQSSSKASHQQAPSPPPQNLSNKFEAEPKTSKPKNYDISMSIARSIADPRAVRVARVLDSGVLNMNMEKVTHYHSMPISSYDFYLGELKKNPSVLRQVGVPTDLEVREIETNTEEISSIDKQIQCCYGDDTEFYNLLQEKSKSKVGKQVETQPREFRHAAVGKEDDDQITGDSSHRLSAFLQRSTQLFEGLFREENSSNESKHHEVGGNSQLEIFDPAEKWVKFGSDSTNGANELIRLRQIVSVKFSKIQSSMLLAAHSYPVGEDAETDLRPFKGLYSLWDTNVPGGPVLILEGAGQPTSCSFSSAQTHVIVAGTSDGSIHLWDTREASAIHRDKDATDLRISKGIRKPTYSTHLSLNSISENNEDEILHGAGILQIEAIDETESQVSLAASQFVSLDEAGGLIFWVTTEQSFNDENLRRSPWGKISLTATRQLNLSALSSAKASERMNSSALSTFLDSKHGLFKGGGVLGLIPRDAATLLVSLENGDVKRISRIGESPNPNIFSRYEISTDVSMEMKRSDTAKEMKSFSSVKCIAVQTLDNDTGDQPLLIIGRADGSIDLFQMDSSFPMLTWELSSFGHKASIQKIEPISISWITNCSFIVVDSSNSIHLFDLSVSMYKPIKSDKLDVKEMLSLDVSRIKSKLDVMRIAVGGGGSILDLKLRRFHQGFGNIRKLDQKELDSLKNSIGQATVGAAKNSKISFNA